MELLELLPILFHRIGLIISFVSAVIINSIPWIYQHESDTSFAIKINHICIYVARTGLSILLITGVLRLQNDIPDSIIIKLILVIITVIISFLVKPASKIKKYDLLPLLLFSSISITSLVGIYL